MTDPIAIDSRLWCMHISGMDEVHPAPDYATAQRWAAQFTVHALRDAAAHPHPYNPAVNFSAQLWPYDDASHAAGLEASVQANTWPVDPLGSFQERVQPWLLKCFGETIAADREERNHRFLEEGLELVQANGCTASEARQLVDYVFGRPVGEPAQEVGGVMVTLAALCLASGLDMHSAAETELMRIWTKVEAIRAKQAAKPKHSPLPAEPATPANDVRLLRAVALAATEYARDYMVDEAEDPELTGVLQDQQTKARAVFDSLAALSAVNDAVAAQGDRK